MTSPLRLPEEVNMAAQAAVGAGRFDSEFAWLSWAGTVWRLSAGSSVVYDPRDDLAAGLWTLHYNFGHGYGPQFLESYGAPAMADKDMERLRRRYGKSYTPTRQARSAGRGDLPTGAGRTTGSG